MKYEEMSDFEINKAVACILFHSYEEVRLSALDNSSAYVENGESDFYDFDSGTFDYCNSPSDAWPIIVDNAISITSIGDLNWNADSLISIEEGANDYNKFECLSACSSQDKDPLRAAMICFLKMKDAEKDNV